MLCVGDIPLHPASSCQSINFPPVVIKGVMSLDMRRNHIFEGKCFVDLRLNGCNFLCIEITEHLK